MTLKIAYRSFSRFDRGCRAILASQRKQRAQAGIAQVKPSPDQDAEDDRGEERLADPNMRGGGAAEIAGQQDRAEDASPRNDKDDRAGELDHPEAERQALGIA